jgi:hypothetical protein
MMTINKQDVMKTVLIIWFVGATIYVAYDLYAGYKIRGMQQAYQTGYATSVDDLIKKAEGSQCQPFEVQKDGKKIQLVNGQCLQQQGNQQSQPSAPQAQPQSGKPVK